MKKQANNIGIIANDEAIKYAKLKYSKYHKDSVYEKDIAETETDFARGFITGFRYVTQWNSPDEKPEKEADLLILKNDKVYTGFLSTAGALAVNYNITDNKIHYSYFDEIDGWQYLPEIK